MIFFQIGRCSRRFSASLLPGWARRRQMSVGRWFHHVGPEAHLKRIQMVTLHRQTVPPLPQVFHSLVYPFIPLLWLTKLLPSYRIWTRHFGWKDNVHIFYLLPWDFRSVYPFGYRGYLKLIMALLLREVTENIRCVHNLGSFLCTSPWFTGFKDAGKLTFSLEIWVYFLSFEYFPWV